MVADVPVGVLLSGGLDSSLIVALLAESDKSGLETFSIGFETSASERATSSATPTWSPSVRHRPPADPHRRRPHARALEAAIAAMSEPMVSHDAVAFYLLSPGGREMGQGRAVRPGRRRGVRWLRLVSAAASTANDAAEQYERAFFDCGHARSQSCWRATSMLDRTSAAPSSTTHFGNTTAPTRAVDAALQIDTEIMLVDDPVKRVDNMTMAWGLEARVPVPRSRGGGARRAHARHELKLSRRRQGHPEGRRAAFRAGRGHRPPKGYFPVPSLRYLRGPFLDYVRGLLNSGKARARGLYNENFVQHMLRHPEAEMSPKGHSRLWQAALLEGWLQTHGI